LRSSKAPIITGLIVGILLFILGVFVNPMLNDYAIVGYQLSGPMNYNLPPININFNIMNRGTIDATPVCMIHIINGTIQQIKISGISENQLQSYCSYNNTDVVIRNIKIPKGNVLGNLATISIVLNPKVSALRITSIVTLPYDWFHPKSGAERITSEIMYKVDQRFLQLI